MTQAAQTDLTLSRRLKAPRHNVWRCWTEPALLMQWFCPAPWRVTEARIDLRPGGRFATSMAGPNGERHDDEHGGVFLEVVPQERLVFTTVLMAGWRPVPVTEGFLPMTVILTLRDSADGGTLYDALVMHPDPATRDRHAAMGFDAGWGLATDQLDALAQSL